MTDDRLVFHIRRLTPDEQKARQEAIPKFTCCLCGKIEEIKKRTPKIEDPVCRLCVGKWACLSFGHVYQRQNYANLRQLSAAVNKLSWEVKNGRYR